MDRDLISRLRTLAPVRAIALAWRAQSPRRTLLACSAGADSSALALALAAAAPAKQRTNRLVLAHVIHDLRPETQAQADAAKARELAELLSVDYVSVAVFPARAALGEARRNLEALARRERYAALAALARDHACDAIATAHHAGDQAETVLMRLLRGTGIDGLRAIHPTRTLAGDASQLPLRLIRPMLAVTRADAEEICRVAGWEWAIDHSNADTSRTRAWIRHEVLPMLEARSPGAASRLASAAAHAQGATDALRAQARDLWRRARTDARPDASPNADIREIVLDRRALREAPAHICAMVIRHAIRKVGDGSGMDRLPAHALARAVERVQDHVGGERQIRLARASMRITREHVRFSPAPARQESRSTNPKDPT